MNNANTTARELYTCINGCIVPVSTIKNYDRK